MPQQPKQPEFEDVDLEAIEGLIQGEGWQHVRTRLALSERQLFEQWYSKGGAESDEFIRGKLHGVRLALGLPVQMVGEIKRAAVKK